MARRLEWVEERLETEFGLLGLRQLGGWSVAADTAGPVRGAVRMLAGVDRARVVVRVERWDARPPVQVGWEESDELGFVERPDGGPAFLHGHDGEPIGRGLSVDGIGDAVVVLHARGRHRYPAWNSDARQFAPEEWLVQLFPVVSVDDRVATTRPGHLDGPHPVVPSLGSWGAAAHEWRLSGWRALLGDVPGVNDLALVLQICDRPLPLDRLLPLMTWLEITPTGVPASADDVLPGLDGPVEATRDRARARTALLARLVGMARVHTWRDLVQALGRIGLLVRWDLDGDEIVVPHPAPVRAWEDPRFTPEQQRAARRAARADQAHHAADVAFLHHWAVRTERARVRSAA